MSTPFPLKMVIFTSKDCPTCQHLKRNVLPAFKKAHPDLTIEEVNIGLDAPSNNKSGEARADAYNVQGLPTIVFEIAKELPQGGAGDCSLSGLNALLERAEGVLGADHG